MQGVAIIREVLSAPLGDCGIPIDGDRFVLGIIGIRLIAVGKPIGDDSFPPSHWLIIRMKTVGRIAAEQCADCCRVIRFPRADVIRQPPLNMSMVDHG